MLQASLSLTTYSNAVHFKSGFLNIYVAPPAHIMFAGLSKKNFCYRADHFWTLYIKTCIFISVTFGSADKHRDYTVSVTRNEYGEMVK